MTRSDSAEHETRTLSSRFASFGLFRNRPGLVLDDVLIDPRNQLPDVLQSLARSCSRRNCFGSCQCTRAASSRTSASPFASPGRRHTSCPVLRDHGDRAAQKISQIVREIAVVALNDRVEARNCSPGRTPFLAAGNNAATPIRILRSKQTDRRRCRGTSTSFRPSTATTHGRIPSWDIQSGGHQKRRPIHRVKAQNVFPDEMQMSPANISRNCRVVADLKPMPLRYPIKRIKPDVEDMRRIVGERNAPLQCDAADRKILQAAANKES